MTYGQTKRNDPPQKISQMEFYSLMFFFDVNLIDTDKILRHYFLYNYQYGSFWENNL